MFVCLLTMHSNAHQQLAMKWSRMINHLNWASYSLQESLIKKGNMKCGLLLYKCFVSTQNWSASACIQPTSLPANSFKCKHKIIKDRKRHRERGNNRNERKIFFNSSLLGINIYIHWRSAPMTSINRFHELDFVP